MNIVRRLVGLMSVVLILFSLSAGTSAQSANGFRVSPIRNELTVAKGTSQSVNIYIENPSSQPLKAKGVFNDFVASDKEDGQPQLLLDGNYAPSHSLKRLMPDIPALDFAGSERKVLSITVTVPANAAAGGYYGALRFVPVDQKNTANVSLTASVGSLFLINVPGNIKEHLQLESFSAAVKGASKKIIFGGQVSIITRIKNDGDTHEKPFGKIQVKDSHGAVVAEQEINNTDPQANILPASIRKFETSLGNKKWFGHYTVTASFGYNPSANNELINAKTSFWYIPYWFAAVSLVLLLAVLIAGYVVYRKLHSHKTRRHRKNADSL